jgi:amidase
VPESVTQVLTDTLARAGKNVEVRKITMPTSYYELAVEWGKTCAVECLHAHANLYPEQAQRYGPGLTWLLELGRTVPADEYAHLQTLRSQFRTELDAVLAEVDVLLAPTMPVAAPSVAQMEQGGLEPESAPFLSFTAPFDYSGHPTLNIPAGIDCNGLPQSVQLIGARFKESGLLAAGAMFERVLGRLNYPMP